MEKKKGFSCKMITQPSTIFPNLPKTSFKRSKSVVGERPEKKQHITHEEILKTIKQKKKKHSLKESRAKQSFGVWTSNKDFGWSQRKIAL